MRRLTLLLIAVLPLSAGTLAHAQATQWTTGPCPTGQNATHNGGLWHWNGSRVCELRRATLANTGSLKMEADNGSITVIGEDRKDIAIEARITVDSTNQKDAAALLRQITIDTNGTIRAHGPHFSGWWSHGGYSVDYNLRVPETIVAKVETANGNVTLKTLHGTLRAESTNGTVTLSDLAGDVHASTVNGGISIRLEGDHWDGAGLTGETVNGGISVSMPTGYSARLRASTVNGGISVDFPVTVEGKITHDLDANIGRGGAPIQMHTVNGGVQFKRRE